MSGANNALLDAIAHPPTVDPMAAQRNALQIAAGVWGNRQSQANQLAGAAFQNSIDPTTGMPNQTALLRNLKSAGPGAALAAQPAAQAGQSLDAGTYTQHLQRLTGMSNAMSALTTQYPGGVPQEAASAAIDREVASGLIPPEMAAQAKANFTADPAQNSRIILQNHIANLNAQAGLLATLPAPTQQNIGGSVRTIDTNPLTNPAGPGSVGTAVPLTTSPETQAGLVVVTNPDGSKTYAPRSTLPNASGQPAASPLGTGRPPAGSPLLNPNAPPGAAPGQAAPGQAATAPANTTAGLPLGAPETIAADVGQFKKDQFAIPQGQQNVQSLQKAQIALEASNTGRNSEGVHNMLATLQTLGVPLPAGVADNVQSYDLAHKLLTDYARRSGAAAHSDLQLQSAEGANASTGISNQAALDVVHMNIGRERQAIAQNMEAPQTGVGYGAHSSKFASSTDPRGFAIDAYKPAELNAADPKSMVGRMTTAERAKFYRSVGIAQRLGLLNTAAPASAPTAASAAPAPQAAAAPYPGQN